MSVKITTPPQRSISTELSANQHQSAADNLKIQLPYAADKASFSREGDSLLITAENGEGETVQIKNFFVVEEGKSLPTLVLQDGSEVNTADFLHAMNPDMDITTAAGQNSAAQGSGVNDYSDQAGTLISGLDRLGALGSFAHDPTVSRFSQPQDISTNLGASATQDGFAGTTPDLPRDDDFIVVYGKDINGIFIHGDSPYTSDLSGNVLLGSTSGNDTITIGDRNDDITNGSVVGGVVDNPEVWGNDTITIEADSITNSTISGGKGADTIIINADGIYGGYDYDEDWNLQLTNPIYISGDDVRLVNTDGFDGDTIIINTDTLRQGVFIGGDAGKSMVNSHGGDSDSITINANSLGGNTFIGGDAGQNMTDSTGGSGDSITVNFSSKTSDDEHTLIGGDAGQDMTNSIGGNADNITINGPELWSASIGGDAGQNMTNSIGGDSDVITITSGMYGSYIGGDAGGAMHGSTGGNSDVITITGDIGNSRIGGDAGQDMVNSIGGSEDTIIINGSFASTGWGTKAYIGGDAAESMYSSTGGNRDNIIINGNVAEDNWGTTAYIGGDAGAMMEKNSVGGNEDSITINGTVSNSYIGGDAGDSMYSSTGGDSDSITITGDVSSSYIGGDAGSSMTNSTGGSGDSITITGSVFGDSYIGGDAGESMVGSSGGDDYITINTLNSGIVSGDAYEMKNSTGGDDYITINTMQGGAVYGDGGKISGTHTGGNDIISIGQLEGTASKIIDGGAGNDLFIYNNSNGHRITLQDNGTVTIVDANDTDITATTNTNITGFEGIGGGSGNDILIGNSGDNLIIGGAGNDVLTGGAGADTFAWGKDHQGTVDSPAIDIITDFSVAEGDVIDLSALLKGYSNGDTNINDYINITNDGINTTINISTNGTGAVDQVIQLQGVSDFSADEILANILLAGGM